MSTDRCPCCGKPYTVHPDLVETCRANFQARDGLVKILALCDALGDGGDLHKRIVQEAEKAQGK